MTPFELVMKNRKQNRAQIYVNASGWSHTSSLARKWAFVNGPKSAQWRLVTTRMLPRIPEGVSILDETKLDRIILHRYLGFPPEMIINRELRALADLAVRYPFLRVEKKSGVPCFDPEPGHQGWVVLKGTKGERQKFSAQVSMPRDGRFVITIWAEYKHGDGAWELDEYLSGFWWEHNREWSIHVVPRGD